MCRSCADGGRRCSPTPADRDRHNQIQKESYRRRTARRATAHAKIDALAQQGITAATEDDVEDTLVMERPDLRDSDKEAAFLIREDFPQEPDGDEEFQVVRSIAGGVVIQIATPEDYQRLREVYPHPDDPDRLDIDAMRADGIGGIEMPQHLMGMAGQDGQPGTSGGGVASAWSNMSRGRKVVLIVLAASAFAILFVAYQSIRKN